MRKSTRQRKRNRRAVREDSAFYGCTHTGPTFTFLEFFAGGGMARAGLAPAWRPVWANDFSPNKAEVYRKNWGSNELHEGDVGSVSLQSVPNADMAWGSFPCQDLSLAGNRSGIGAADDPERTRSGTFWPFWNIVRVKLPPIVVLENVEGALTSNGGRDFAAICHSMSNTGYRFGALVLDAVHWTPQSRARLFVIAVARNVGVPTVLHQEAPDDLWHTKAVRDAYWNLNSRVRSSWIWWSLPAANVRPPNVERLIEREPKRWVKWDSPEKTEYLLSLMNERHREKVRKAQMMGRRIVGFAYRRTRAGNQRAEVRFDGIAGCLRTSAGGSSRQIVVEVTGECVRTRLLSPLEAARLQGLPDDYSLPEDYNCAYDVVGDGLCVPVVRFLGEKLLTPIAVTLNGTLRAIA